MKKRDAKERSSSKNASSKSSKVAKYEVLIESSWKQLKNNLNLFIPNLIMIFIGVLLAFFFLYLSGLYEFFTTNPALIEHEFNNIISQFYRENPFQLVYAVVVYLVLMIFSDIFLVTAKYGMIKDVIKKGKTTLSSGIAFARKHFFTVFDIYVISLFLIGFPIFMGWFMLKGLLFKTPIDSVLITLYILISIVYALFIIFRLLWVYPTMTFEEEGPLKSIKDDFHYVKTHMGHTFISWFIIIGAAIIYSMAKSPLKVITNSTTNIIVILAVTVIAIILEVIVLTWEHLFVFNAYMAGRKASVRLKE